MNAIALPLVAMLRDGAKSFRETTSPARLSTRFLSKLLLPPCGHSHLVPTIPARPKFWLFRLGLPYPVQTTKEVISWGGSKCVFSGERFSTRP